LPFTGSAHCRIIKAICHREEKREKKLAQKEDTSERNGIDTSEEKRNKASKSFDRTFSPIRFENRRFTFLRKIKL
jgi:hypothetical protein